MDTRTLLTKLIILIYRSRQLGSTDHDDLIRTIIGTLKLDTKEQNFLGTNYTVKLKDYVLTLLNEKDIIPVETILPTLGLLLEHDPKLLGVIKEALLAEYDEETTKRVISSNIKSLNNYYRECLAIEVIGKMSYDLKFNRTKIGDFGTYMQNALAELEPLAFSQTQFKDPAIVNEVDFENRESLDDVFEEVQNLASNEHIYKFSWQALNRMTQGGIRRGEFMTVAGLQHSGKSTISLSMFMQIAMENKPIVTKEEAEQGKKPLMVRISFEDPLANNLSHMYTYSRMIQGNYDSGKDIKSVSVKEMSEHVLKTMTVNGFHIKMMRVDPSQWTYVDVINKIIEYESQGYAVHVLALDYIGMLPTTGCIGGNPATEFRDLLRRLRNVCSAKGIAFMSPLQLSTEAKQLLRNGVPAHHFVKEIANLGYYDRSKSLDQEIDVELFISTFTTRGKSYVAIQRGKHRLPTMCEEEDLFFMIPYKDRHTPLLPDLHGDDTSIKTLPRGSVDTNTTDLLSEVLG